MADRLTVGVAARLSRYLQVLTQAKKMGKERISSQEIADYTNINATQIRRDLSGFGKFGKRGVGYNIDSLLGEIRKILRTQGQHNIALIGAGRLGEAIASCPIFAEHGINIAAVFDTDPGEGRPARRQRRGVAVRAASRVGARQEHHRRRARGARRRARSASADDLVGAGVKIIFNYSEALLDVPSDVAVHTSNPAVELLYALYFHLDLRDPSLARVPARRDGLERLHARARARVEPRRARGRRRSPRSGIRSCTTSAAPSIVRPEIGGAAARLRARPLRGARGASWSRI